MKLPVDYLDPNGKHHSLEYPLTRLAFTKHFAIAGQRYAPLPRKLFRSIAMFIQFSYFMNERAFREGRFSSPPDYLYDPTEKAQFSNLAGKAIADFLSKRIGGSLFTVNYEAEMKLRGMRIKGSRPDLIAYAPHDKFAIEAKGYSGGPGDMNHHKAQSEQGGIPVNYTVASVTYQLYRETRCNYYDPHYQGIPYDLESLRTLSRNYYSGLIKFLDLFQYAETDFFGETFFEVDLSSSSDNIEFYPQGTPIEGVCPLKAIDYYEVKLILPGEIKVFAEAGISNDTTPFFVSDTINERHVYIDSDRIGLSVRAGSCPD